MFNEMPSCTPTQADFSGEDLQIVSVDWSFDRAPNTGGANVGQDYSVPSGRVIVGWEARETSCIRCQGSERDVRLSFESRGPLRLPVAVHVGVRFKEELNPAGSGASYTGTITMVSVPFEKWKR